MSWLTARVQNPAARRAVGRAVTGLLLGALTAAGLLPAECGEPLLANLLRLFGS